MSKEAIVAWRWREDMGDWNVTRFEPSSVQPLNVDVEALVPATLLASQEAEIERYRKALTECASEWRSPPTTMGRAFEYVSEEFKRRMQVAADALAEGGNG